MQQYDSNGQQSGHTDHLSTYASIKHCCWYFLLERIHSLWVHVSITWRLSVCQLGRLISPHGAFLCQCSAIHSMEHSFTRFHVDLAIWHSLRRRGPAALQDTKYVLPPEFGALADNGYTQFLYGDHRRGTCVCLCNSVINSDLHPAKTDV